MSEQKSIQDIRGRVRKVFEGKLKRKVSLTENLQEMGLDSLDTTDIVMRLEDVFGIRIPDEDYKSMCPGFESLEKERGICQQYITIEGICWYTKGRFSRISRDETRIEEYSQSAETAA